MWDFHRKGAVDDLNPKFKLQKKIPRSEPGKANSRVNTPVSGNTGEAMSSLEPTNALPESGRAYVNTKKRKFQEWRSVNQLFSSSTQKRISKGIRDVKCEGGRNQKVWWTPAHLTTDGKIHRRVDSQTLRQTRNG